MHCLHLAGKFWVWGNPRYWLIYYTRASVQAVPLHILTNITNMVACTARAAQKLPVLVSIIPQIDCLRALSPSQITRHAPKVVNIAFNVAVSVNNSGAGCVHAYGQICVVQISRAIYGVPITYMICIFMQHGLRVVNGCLPVCGVAIAFGVVLGVLRATAQ